MASIVCQGGKIGQVFGGGDAKGSCGNTNAVTKQEGDCPLHITRLYGAGNKGDVSSVNIVLAACSDNAIDYVHGGSYNAHVHGDVHLTITSGVLKNVYGGNDARGGIEGNIIVDIEETNGCNPIIIQNLVGGGNEAPYPGTKTNNEGVEVPIGTHGKITVNVKSATRIDNVYGGSYMAEADADTEVNINMIKGCKAGTEVTIPQEFSYIPNISGESAPSDGVITRTINDAIGTIGNVYGGGNLGLVKGKTTVNIGASDHVEIMARDANGKILNTSDTPLDIEDGKNITPDIASTIKYNNITDATSHLGVNITGSVYGGGREADVTGNTYVNICAKDNGSGTYVAVTEGTDKVKIAGNVFGGGKGIANSFTCEKAMIGVVDDGATVTGTGESATYTLKDGGTTVTIGHGEIGGSVYGGGEIGRVERNTKVTIGIGNGSVGAAKSPVIEGEVYGGGQGVTTHGYSGLVRGNSNVTIEGDSWIKQSVYGAGKLASLGRYWIATTPADATAHGVEIGMPWGLKCGGQSTVTIQGYAKIGPAEAMTMPEFSGNVFGAGKGILPYDVVGEPGRYYYDNGNYTWESYADESKEDDYLKYVETLGITNNAIVTIGGNAFVMGSVYGGSENGTVFADTEVNISGGQIGCGEGMTAAYTAGQWASPSGFKECAHWSYEAPFAPYDKYADQAGYNARGGAVSASDGHTFYGNVFGGGSGKDPYKPGKWHRLAGFVGGNTKVNITGGHILTSVYGGNEMTDVGSEEDLKVVEGKGKCTINMVGGTLGVPRTEKAATEHPVTCYLFGAGKGDQRTFFNTWTNVSETEVNVTGDARIFGSVFGGGEDGHVLGNAKVNIGGSVKIDLNGDGDTDDSGETFTAQESLKIGTTGTSYVDGNVFGGGRGFSGEALTAGSVGGNVEVNISGGTMLGSVYGGGRLASVGTYFTDPDADEYGQLQEDEGGKTYGHINVNISGGTIGNATPPEDSEYSKRQYSGNVYGGCMGRTTLINGDINPIWPELAQSKFSTVNIYGNGTHITRNVYGGAEFGVVRENAKVTIGGKQDENGTTTTQVSTPTIDGYVYGAGHGSDDYQHYTTIDVHWGGETRYFTYTPMQWAGCVGGNTTVNLAGGEVKRIYGGGELASVGVIDYSVTEDPDGSFTYKNKTYSYTNIVKHTDLTNGFALSWPYKFTYVPCNPSGFIGGLATVNVTGSAIVNEYVYGGGKGQVAFTGVTDIDDQRYVEAFCANVRNTQVTIGTSGGSGDTPTIGVENTTTQGTVYGGAEDGHVYEDANVTIHHGRIVHTVFGGGKGEGTYTTTLLDPTKETPTPKGNSEPVYSWTAGKVYGNTNVTVNGGSIGWFVYGGGNKASVGKGNYSGGADDYSTAGYGETLTGNLWTISSVGDDAWEFLNSGKTTVTIMGGNVGPTSGTGADGDGIPHGSVFGGSRGKAAKTITKSPRYKYDPDFFLGYVNKATINIGGYIENSTTTLATGDGPRIYGSIYGGGQDGHVRNSTEVRMFKGNVSGQGDYRSGNVFGAGSGVGKFTDGENSYCNNASGSVTCSTLVEVSGGTIASSVYGGGALASVGPPKIDQSENEQKEESDGHKSYSCNVVNVKGGTITGSVYGAGRGPGDAMFENNGSFSGVSTEADASADKYNPTTYATSIWTEVNITGGTISNNVYGGGEMGLVKESTVVNLTGGTIAHDAYGGGKGTTGTNAIEANVGGNTTVKLNEGVEDNVKGCVVNKVYGCNDLNGTPKGHVLVHVHATQTSGRDNVSAKAALPPSYSANKASDEGYIVFMTKLIEDVTKTGGLASDASVINTARNTINNKNEATLTDYDKADILNAAKAIDDAMNGLYDSYGYDVAAVYGGGDLAPYEPTSDAEETEVIIEGCGTTSIRQVYGGGNAASVPATDVTVKSCYIIEELFGGGNGKDNYQIDGKWYENPGAHIGYTQFATYDTSGSHGTGADEANKYTAIVPRDANDAEVGPDAAKAYRQEHYRYGTGVASSIINGGHVHKAYGGSNEKGNISGEINSQLQQVGTCTIVTDGTYGGSKTADTDATIIVVLDCVENGGEFFGGSYKANVNSDVNIHITNGHYTKVFGGNDRAGTVNGKITITIEEYGCTPIEIDELYAGGNLAPYSVYGFKNETQKAKDANGNDISDLDQRIPYRAGEIGARTTPYWDPRINIISATRIGAIYGGGYGAGATLIGNPHINVNMTEGRIRAKYADYKSEYLSLENATDGSGDKVIPIGTIGSIYGGGNLASVEGDTYLEIGTGQWIASWDANGNPVWESTTANGEKYSYKEKVPAVYYSQAECNEYNSNPVNNVTGYIASGTALTAEQVTAVKAALGTNYVEGAELTTQDANAYNATLPGARKTTDVKTSAVYYTQEEIDAAQEGDPAYGKTVSDIKTPAVYYTQAECDEYNKTNCTNYIAKHTKLTAEQATTINNTLTPSYSAGNPISAADANAYNATLPNARKTTDVKTPAVWAWYDADGTEMTTPPTLAPRNAATITGNVFGGGKGVAETTGSTAFTCPKGMIGVDGDGIDYPEGGTSVIIANGTVGTLEGEVGFQTLKAGTGNVYGGGEVGRVEKNTAVTIGVTPKDDETIANTKFKPVIYGSVFGAGKGVATHGYSALVRGNSNVTIQGFANVGQNVYGGGEIASIGRYNVVGGRPTSLKNPNSGNCIVTVCDNAEIGPDDMTMTKEGGPDNAGHVFGAGKGAMPGNYSTAEQMTIGNTMAGFTSEDDYLKFIETLGLATHTDVTINGNAFLKGSVFGGAEQGFVQHDTHVTIEGDCQIGNGYVQMNDNGEYLTTKVGVNRRYTTKEWEAGHLFVDGDTEVDASSASEAALKTAVSTNYASSLPECASWKYQSPYSIHDIYAGTSGYDSKGGAITATNGSSFYGNVFGGGSGYFPYAAGKWHWKAGDVGGNTLVEIKGGHILTNVYGGNELTNVAGKSTVNMSGGTIGVPRTLGQIAAHPVTCYLFGAGKGDPRVLFNKQTNVNDVEVNVTGGWVYGSVFGGGEDGHVMRDVAMTISDNAKIGTWGTSYVDGNVFGGGRGFAGDAYTAGNVAGTVTLNISGGTMLGSVYGGGRLGSVGYGLYEETETGKYGTMRPDNYADDGTTEVANFKRGYVTMNISGGTIGNKWEFIVPTGNGPISNKAFGSWTDEDWTSWKNTNHVPNTEYDTSSGRVLHTKGGNVYAGGMGRYYMLDGVTPITSINWWKLGNVKSTSLTVSGENTWIMGNVYGGGELGAVVPFTDNTNAQSSVVQGGTTTISITGGTIGTEITETTPVKETVSVPENSNSNVLYTFGSVYGGGMGMEGHDAQERHGGEVGGTTTVEMSGENTAVRASVFGGGEMAAVDGNTKVTISGGKIGRDEVKHGGDPDAGYVMFGGATMGNVYGGGKGHKDHTEAGLVKGNTEVTINPGSNGQPFIYHNVYGGGALGSVGTFSTSTGTGELAYIPEGIPYGWNEDTGTAKVTVKGGTIGISGRDNGMVFGSSRGDISKPDSGKDPYDKVAWVKEAVVTIGETSGESAGPHIKGSVYGGGENGHNENNAEVTVNSGTIGIVSTDDPWYSFIPEGMTKENESYDHYAAIESKAMTTRGNVYGAGCGTDTYWDDEDGDEVKDPDEMHHNSKAGMVCGNTVVNIKGGIVAQNVYGGGSLGSVGTLWNDPEEKKDGKYVYKHDDETKGFALSWPYELVLDPAKGKAKTDYLLTGGHIGNPGRESGDVFGSARGEAGDRYETGYQGYVRETEVNINYSSTPDMSAENFNFENLSVPCIAGSVHGSGENGFVYGDTKVTLNEGLIGHSLYGAGKGTGTYTRDLKKIGGSDTYPAKIYSLIAGRVMGNTEVTMNGGRVVRNVYGGGNMGSVGKGNFASGTDDYAYDSEIGAAQGYGEKIDAALWTPSEGFNPNAAITDSNKPTIMADYFLSSGKATVKVLGGIVGYPDNSEKNNMPYGNVFGGSAGEAAPNIVESPRYLYSPAFFSGYVNETDVTIGGGYRCTTACTIGGISYKVGDTVTAEEFNAFGSGESNWTAITAPKIYASVYGGGQDGHVRRDTKVTVNNGEIGLKYDETNRGLLKADDINDPQWLFRGNVFGAGSGISQYKYDFNYDGDTDDEGEQGFSDSAGSVTRFTQVNVLGGTIHRNVYGGGSMGSVGAPNMGQTYDPYEKDDKTEGHGVGKQSLNEVIIGGAKVGNTFVEAKIGDEESFKNGYGGNVFGASRGNSTLDEDKFATSIWTKVMVKDGAYILGNVYGGGDAGKVKQDTDVQIGEKAEP